LRDAAEVRFMATEPGAMTPATPDAGPAPARRFGASQIAIALLALLLIAAVGWNWLGSGDVAPASAEIVRAYLPPPDGTRFFLSSRQPGPAEISPDGTRIVFVARGEGRDVALWVQSLGTGEAARLEGTEGASYPFWSPDSRHVAFYAQSKLKRVPADGGAVLTLCDAMFGKGGSWNRSGQIVFPPAYNTPLYVVSENGGEPLPVTQFASEARFNSHRFPFFLPDGQHLLYLARDNDGSAATHEVRLAHLEQGDLGSIVASPAQAAYRAGHLLYVRDGALLARPFDPRTRALGGQPFVVVPRVEVIRGAARAVFSASDDGKLIYIRQDESASHGMQWIGRDGKRLGGFEDLGSLYYVAMTRDGNRLAANTDHDLWVFDLRRGTRQRVTYGQRAAEYPVWSPDETMLYFRAVGEHARDIYVKSADGSGEERLVLATANDKVTDDVSPDGAWLAYSEGEQETGMDIRMVSLEDPDAEPLPFLVTPFDEESARFSPDGRYVAYQSSETGTDEIFVASFPDRKFRAQVSTAGGFTPEWKQDGTEIYFHSPREEVMAAPITLREEGIDVGTPEVLFYLTTPAYGNYAVHEGRFLVEAIPERGDRLPLRLVLNWPSLAEE
jgi:Tol biopolymer transport system component